MNAPELPWEGMPWKSPMTPFCCKSSPALQIAGRWGRCTLGIVEKAHELHLAGATVLRGPLGFGQSGKLHRGHLLPSTQDLPVVIEIVDSEAKINTFLPVLDEMMESGLVTIEKALVLHYGRQRATLLSRLKQQIGIGTKPPLVH